MITINLLSFLKINYNHQLETFTVIHIFKQKKKKNDIHGKKLVQIKKLKYIFYFSLGTFQFLALPTTNKTSIYLQDHGNV